METVYVVDASVVVKWLNQGGEQNTHEALQLLQGAIWRTYRLETVDLVFSEVLNALIRGKGLKGSVLEEAVDRLFELPLSRRTLTLGLARRAAVIAETAPMTFYDAVYVALAVELRTPLLTANVRDQGKFAGASVYDIAKWK